MILKFKTLAAFWAACISVVFAQPKACSEDTECNTGFHCENYDCRKCLQCDELKREDLQPRESCVKSVLQCGPCKIGFEDLGLDGRCGAPPSPADDGPPTYIWILISFGVLLILVGLIVLIFIILKKGNVMPLLKILNVHTTLSPRDAAPPDAPSAPSAPMTPPPAYDESWDRPVSPDLPEVSYAPNEDAARPFIKRAPAPQAGPREPAARQAARPFSNPAYVRGPPSVNPSEDSEPGSPFPPHDEETLESTWTPNEPSNNNTISNVNFGSVYAVEEEAAAGVARTRRASQDGGPPCKALRRAEEESTEAEPEAGPGAPGAVTVVINNFTNVSLPRR